LKSLSWEWQRIILSVATTSSAELEGSLMMHGDFDQRTSKGCRKVGMKKASFRGKIPNYNGFR